MDRELQSVRNKEFQLFRMCFVKLQLLLTDGVCVLKSEEQLYNSRMIQLIEHDTLELDISNLVFFCDELLVHDLQSIHIPSILLLRPYNLVERKFIEVR